jgi:molybdopterin-guanine dinucleotide biosynthesis protein A
VATSGVRKAGFAPLSNHVKEDFDTYILIGGRSSRLGTDKARVEIGGKTLLRRSIDAVQGSLPGSRITAVAANESQFATDAIASEVPFIFDLHENRGPLGGLHAALAYAKTPWIFILACDYPFVSPELIRLLSERVDDQYGCVVPRQSDGRMQPLCAFYKVSSALPIVEEIIERPRVPPPMHEIVDMLMPRILDCDEYSHLENAARLFVNINTQDDLISARSREVS